MNEMTEAGEKAKGGKGKGGKGKATKGDDATVEGQIGRMLVRAIWAQEWIAAHPDAKPEDRKAAWKEGRNDALEKNLKSYRRALSTLTRSGVIMSIAPDAATEADDGEDA